MIIITITLLHWFEYVLIIIILLWVVLYHYTSYFHLCRLVKKKLVLVLFYMKQVNQIMFSISTTVSFWTQLAEGHPDLVTPHTTVCPWLQFSLSLRAASVRENSDFILSLSSFNVSRSSTSRLFVLHQLLHTDVFTFVLFCMMIHVCRSNKRRETSNNDRIT